MKTIVIDGVIGKGEGEISSSMVLSQLPTDGSPIHVKLHSEGGDVFEGFRIHDVFAAYTGPKKLTIESSAFSISSFIPMAFEDIEITPNGYMMIHPPRLSMEDAKSSDLDQKSTLLKQLESTMYAKYASRTGKPIDEIKAICEQETFFNADQCVAIGLANRITQTPVSGRVFAKTNYLPHGVVTALFGAGVGGNKQSQTKEPPMSDSTPVAATVKQIKAAYPKASDSFVIKCMAAEMPMEQVQTARAEELEQENETLSAKVKAMEDELTALKAQLTPPPATEQAARAKSGIKPVAKGPSSSAPQATSAKARWTSLVSAKIQSGMARNQAIHAVDQEEPTLREEMLQEANS